MKFSYLVHTPDGKIGVSDSVDGDRRIEQLFATYGDCKIEVRDFEQVFGHGIEHGKPLIVSTITKVFGG